MAAIVGRRLDALGRRWPWVGTARRVRHRFGEIHGTYLGSALTLACFVSLLPLLFATSAVVGFLASGRVDFVARVVDQLGLTGDAARLVTDAIDVARDSRQAASIVGLVGLLLSGLGVVSALQYAYDEAWQVQGRGIKDKLVGLVWLAGAVLIILPSFAVRAQLRRQPIALAPLNFVLGVGVGVALFLWSSRVLPSRTAPRRVLLPGAVCAGIALELLKFVGVWWVPRLVTSSSAIYGAIGAVFAILAWLAVLSQVLVYCMVLNVVRWEEKNGTVHIEIEVPTLERGVPTEGTRDGDVRTVANR